MTQPQLSEARLGQAQVRTLTRQREAALILYCIHKSTAVVKVKAEASMPTLRRGWNRDVKPRGSRRSTQVPVDADYPWRFDTLLAKYNNYLLILYYPKIALITTSHLSRTTLSFRITGVGCVRTREALTKPLDLPHDNPNPASSTTTWRITSPRS